ncbi:MULTISPECIES: DUF4172 domain-containing protein [Aeromonas]|nr:DUF4172 domain-containing protein [Aeromonas jandaei]
MEPFWIWQQADWPHFRWQDSEVLPPGVRIVVA